MSSPTSLDDLSNMPETGNTIKTLHELKQESSPDSNNEMNIDGEMSNDNSNHSNSNHKMHTYDGDFVMDNEYNDYEELRKSLVNKRRLSSIKRPHGPFLDHNNQIDKRSLLRLPTEILLQIFHYLERRDWYSLLTTCSEIADLIIEMLWFRPHMQNDSAFKKIKEVMEINKSVTHWDYRQFIKRLNLSFMTKLVDDELLSLFIGCPRLERVDFSQLC